MKLFNNINKGANFGALVFWGLGVPLRVGLSKRKAFGCFHFPSLTHNVFQKTSYKYRCETSLAEWPNKTLCEVGVYRREFVLFNEARRSFHRYLEAVLTFWFFWVKPKEQNEMKDVLEGNRTFLYL